MTKVARPAKPPSPSIGSLYTQMFPPNPAFTANDIPDLSGKVYIITGSNTGVGKELARMLYSKNARIYIAARSEEKAIGAIDDIKASCPKSTGCLIFQKLDMADLAGVKQSAEWFCTQESSLHGLYNNAGVQALQNDQVKTAQGHEIHLGVNAFGPFLFTNLLAQRLVETASREPAGTVRVIWVSSLGTEVVGEKSKGISLDYLNYWPALSPLERYGVSKAGNWLYGVEFARRFRDQGVISIPANPGHLKSDLYRDMSGVMKAIIHSLVCHPPIMGAYTELFAGFSPSITIDQTGQWVIPWGRLYHIRKDLLVATKSEAEGGNDHAKKFWEWSETQVRDFL